MKSSFWHDAQNIEDREDGMITSGWDNANAVAWRIVNGMRATWEYEGDRKQAAADIAQRLQEAYEVGMNEAMRDQVPQRMGP